MVALARVEARRLGHNYVGTEHVLLGIPRKSGGAVATVLKWSGVDLDGVGASVEGIVGQDDGDQGPSRSTSTLARSGRSGWRGWRPRGGTTIV